jgi:putative flippase GtrA
VSATALFDRVPRFVRFLACGGIAAAVNWASRFGWSTIMPFSLAVLAAYVTGMVVAFVLFREFVFERASTGTSEQVRNFVIVNVVGMAATWALANLLVYWALPAAGMTRHVEAIGHGIAIFAPVVTSWFGHRFLTFR